MNCFNPNQPGSGWSLFNPYGQGGPLFFSSQHTSTLKKEAACSPKRWTVQKIFGIPKLLPRFSVTVVGTVKANIIVALILN